MCMLSLTTILVPSEAMSASKQARKSLLTSKLNSVTSETYLPRLSDLKILPLDRCFQQMTLKYVIPSIDLWLCRRSKYVILSASSILAKEMGQILPSTSLILEKINNHSQHKFLLIFHKLFHPVSIKVG